MATPPKIVIHLQTDSKTCFLNGDPRFSLVVLLTLQSERSVSFVKFGSESLAELLTNGCVDCTDTESARHISVLDGHKSTQANESKIRAPELMRLEPRRTNYVTFTNDANPRAYELGFISSILQADRKYQIQCSAADLKWWSYETPEAINKYFEDRSHLPVSEPHPLHLEPDKETVSFDTRVQMAQAPKVDVSLSAASTFSILGKPPFEYSITFTSRATKSITVRWERQRPTSINTEIEILDFTTRKRVAPNLIDINEDDERPLFHEDILRLEPGQPHVERSVLDPTKHYSSLEDLEFDNQYVLRLIERREWWSYDDIDQVITDAGKKGTGGLRPTQPIQLTSSNEVHFTTV